MEPTIFPGFPATIEKFFTDFFNTVPAASIEPFPMLTPGHIIAPTPMNEYSPMCTDDLM